MKTVFRLLLCSVLFAACGESDTVVFDGSSNKQTLMGFDADAYTLPVKINETGSVDITVESSTISDQDRVINIARVETGSNASPAVYDLPASVVIPAGKYIGTFTIVGTDVDLEAPQTLVIEFTPDNENVITDRTVAVVKIQQVCPIIRDEFVGTYAATELPGPYNYFCEVLPGAGPNDLIIKNLYDISPSTTTLITLSGDEYNGNITWPTWENNFLYTHSTYGFAGIDPWHPNDTPTSKVPSFVNACTKTITLYFRVRVAAGTFPATTVTLVKQ